MADHSLGEPGPSVSTRKRSRSTGSPSGPLTGQKRDKYTVVACNQCRKRKIKCNGETPCRRCESYDLSCTYAQSYGDNGSQSASKGKIAALEHSISLMRADIAQLSASLKPTREAGQNLRGSTRVTQDLALGSTRSPHNSIRQPAAPRQPQFVGPTSSAYNFNVANNTLQMMGIQPSGPDIPSHTESGVESRCANPERPGQVEPCANDPLLSIEMSEIYHALEIYKEELNSVYPLISPEEIIKRVPLIYEHLQRGHGSNLISPIDNPCCQVDNKDAKILKLIVASALVLEGRGRSIIASQLVDSVEWGLSTSAREVEVDLKGLQLFTLTSIYHFHCDEPVLAWRTIGFASRIALEMGLHRKDSLEQIFPDLPEREWAVRLFWCIYVLDRRWSFGTGMPFAMQDSDIDPDLPQVHDSEPYLKCLVAYGKICSKVWNAVAGFSKKEVDNDTVGYLDFQIQQWVQSIPRELQLVHPRLGDAARNQPRNLQRLRVLLYIRGNQMRSFVHRHNVLSASNISRNLAGARLVTDIAIDTIRVLVHLRETSNIYDTQQCAFNYFLVSAISAIFLAVCHAPAEFGQSCRDDFHNALGLLSDLSAHSYVSRRLWKSVRGLRHIAPKLGLTLNKPIADINVNVSRNAHDPYASDSRYSVRLPASSGIAAMATIPGAHQLLRPHNSYNTSPPSSVTYSSINMASMSDMSPSNMPDVFQMGNELTNLFEALGHHVDGQQPPDTTPDWMTEEINLLQNGGEVSRLFEGLL